MTKQELFIAKQMDLLDNEHLSTAQVFFKGMFMFDKKETEMSKEIWFQK